MWSVTPSIDATQRFEGSDGYRRVGDREPMTERPSLCSFTYEIVSQPVSGMPERVVMDYDTREEAEDALAWYTATFSPPAGALWVREVANDA